LVAQFLAARGLERARAKPRITPSEEGFACLGTHLRQYPGKRLGTPAKQNVHACWETIRHLGQQQQHATAGHLLLPLPPGMRGWAQYPPPGASQQTLAKGDPSLLPLRWQWAPRRHPHQSRWWITETDVRSEHGNTGMGCGQGIRSPGKGHAVRLFHARRGPIRRHTKSQGDAHPYDPQWEPDCAARVGVRRARPLHGRRQLRRRWKEQEGRWAVCQQRITALTGWQSPHSVWRTHGGADRADHRGLLHPTCHTQVHHQRFDVVQPRPPRGVRKAGAACGATRTCRSEGAGQEQSCPATRRPDG
jgi:RNA-directed DNA polymerase